MLVQVSPWPDTKGWLFQANCFPTIRAIMELQEKGSSG